MNFLGKVFSWGFGVIFILAGLGSLATSIGGGLIYLLLGLFLVPAIRGLIEKKSGGAKLPKPLFWIIVVVLFFGGSMVIADGQKEEASSAYKDAVSALDAGNVNKARDILNKINSNSSANSGEISRLETDINKSSSDSYAKEVLGKMSDSEYKSLTEGSFNKRYFNHDVLNDGFLKILKTNAPNRDKIIEERKAAQKEAEKQRKIAEKQRKIAEKQKRKAMIENRKSQTIKARTLVRDYIKNEVRADGKYKGKEFYVYGIVDSIGNDIMNDAYVTLRGAQFRTVQCFVKDKNVAANLDKGQRVTFHCECKGLMMNVLMRDCQLVKNL